MSRIEVIIVNYNAGDALVRCVESVLEQDEQLRLTVMDNASTDGSAEQLRQRFGQQADVTVVDSGGNPGFAGAVNMALHLSAGDTQDLSPDDYLLILNPDCEMRDGALASLVQALDREEEAALAAPLVVDAGGKALRGTLRRFPDPWKSFVTFTGLWRLGRRHTGFSGVDATEELPKKTSQAEAVSGACMLLKKSVFLAAGGMDEAYGLHCEDLDLMYRLRLMGKVCLFVPGAVVYHEQGVSSRSRPVWVHWQKHRGMQRFFQKFQAGEYSFPLRWLVIAGIWTRFALTLPMQLIRN